MERLIMNLFNDNIIKEYQEWENANQNNFSWWNFVNMKADLDIALAFAKFYCPEIIEVEGCYLLKDKFNQEIFNSWKVKCSGNKQCIEKMMNLYQLRDFFHINQKDYNKEKNIALGEVLTFFWTASFEKRYPNEVFRVEIYEETDEELFITVYKEN